MEDSIITSVILPVSLGIIMFGMGLTLVPGDFKRVAQFPKGAILGLINQLVLLPIIGFGLAYIFNLSPVIAVGLMIIAACPGGATSNLITHVARGNVALSISLTAITSFVTVFTIPLILTFALQFFYNDTATVIELPVLQTILQIMGITLVPVTIGMIVRRVNQKFANRMEKPMRIASTVIFVAVLAGVILANKESLIPYMQETGFITLLLNLLTMGLGFFSARLLKLDEQQTISITIESGIQNGTLAIVIATSILKVGDMSIPAATYSLIMFFTGGFMMWYYGRKRKYPASVDVGKSI